MNGQIPTHSEEFLPSGIDLLGSSLPENDTAGVLLEAGGKPSTRFPPGGLVELCFFQRNQKKKNDFA